MNIDGYILKISGKPSISVQKCRCMTRAPSKNSIQICPLIVYTLIFLRKNKPLIHFSGKILVMDCIRQQTRNNTNNK